MLARHPLTGKDIRIISLDTSVCKENKTIIWFDEATSPSSASRYARWDVGAVTVNVARRLTALGLQPDIVLCENSTETLEWFGGDQVSKARVVSIPKSFVERIGVEKLMSLRLGNLICVDEIHDMYPFVGGKWDGSIADAQLLLSMILQMNRVFLTTPLETKRPLRNLRIVERGEEPPPLWFITQYYLPEKASRRSEIQKCLAKNLECPLIDKVVLLNETACAPRHKKLEEHVIRKRLTYADVIRWIYEEVPANTLVAFANADIFLHGDSWRNLWGADLETQAKFLALLRWDVEGDSSEEIARAKIFTNSNGPPRVDSQDTWVLSSNSVKATSWDWSALNFPFGKGGCDNAITVEMFKKRFLVANPAWTLQTYHLHASGVRGYNPADIVDKPVYLYISASGLHDKKPVTDLATAATDTRTLSFKPFDRRISGPLTPAQARTFCTMVSRSTQGEINLEVDGANTWSPPPISLHRFKDIFQTRNGLAYTHETILLGLTKAGQKAWSESQISYLASAIQVNSAMIVPLTDEVANTPSRFVLEYMAKIFLLRKEFGSEKDEFWCSKNEGCTSALKVFSWSAQEIPVLSRDDNQQSWCSQATLWPHQDMPVGFVSQEEVVALRLFLGLGGWVPTSDRRLIIVVDSKWLTQEVADALENELEAYDLNVRLVWAGRTSLDTVLKNFRGAWGVVMFDQSFAAWSWVLPKGARLWDIQSEMEPTAALLHLASAAGLEHRLTIVPRGSNDVEKKALVAKLFDSIRSEFPPPPKTPSPVPSKPKLFMPKGHTGFYAHAGDSFRETAAVWAERGYVELIPSAAHQVWLHAVGDTLLYDRPTHQWLEQAPPNEKIFRKALFGNPASPNTLPKFMVTPWSFWPRRPRLVEEAVASGLPRRSWESRERSVVFYGRSENAVQKARRATTWSTACSEFLHVDGLSKYPFTAEEYLERLASAKYGLCLAGYGFKCHREIECMAMGTVPIVAPEVDMENYANPPEEGLHYLRVSSPEDVEKLVSQITGERWTVMSNACRDWWLRNASIDGMWALTQQLAA